MKMFTAFLQCFLVFGLSFFSACGKTSLTDGLSANEHRLFVTRDAYNGNLGGLAGADQICQQEAVLSGLTRAYRALLVDRSHSLSDRFTADSLPVYSYSVDGKEKVADELILMLSGLSQDGRNENFQVRFDLSGAEHRGMYYWAGYDQTGSDTLNIDCEEWTSTSVQAFKRSNFNRGISSEYCSNLIHLVCVSI